LGDREGMATVEVSLKLLVVRHMQKRPCSERGVNTQIILKWILENFLGKLRAALILTGIKDDYNTFMVFTIGKNTLL
jgi:hypothetical protein